VRLLFHLPLLLAAWIHVTRANGPAIGLLAFQICSNVQICKSAKLESLNLDCKSQIESVNYVSNLNWRI